MGGVRQSVVQRDEDLSSLVGELREGVTLVQNLVQILRSPRLGPRQLSRELPELAQASDQVAQPLRRLAAASADVLAAEPEAVEALTLLSERATTAQRQVSAELTDLSHDELGARRRLEIDAVASTAVEHLAALCHLGELLSFAASPRIASVDLADVADVGRERPQAERMARADSRMVRLLLDMAVRELAHVSLENVAGTEIVELGRTPDGRVMITVRAQSSNPVVSESSLATHRVLSAVARRSGHEWTLTATGGALTL